MLKRVLSIVISIAMLVGIMPAVGFAADLSEVGAELICDNMSDVGCFGGGHYVSDGLITNTDSSIPVKQYMTHTNIDDQGATGIRHVNTKNYFQVVEGEYIVAEYWIKAIAPEGSTEDATFSGTLGFTNGSTFGNLGTIKDIEESGTIKIKSGVWYKRYQIFKADRTTVSGETTSGVANGTRLWITTGKINGQTTYVGDVKMYRFPADFAVGELTGAEAIASYMTNASLEAAYVGGEALEGFDADVYSYDLGDADSSKVTVSAASAFANVITDDSSSGTLTATVSAYPYNSGKPTAFNDASVVSNTYTFNGASGEGMVTLLQDDMSTLTGFGSGLHTYSFTEEADSESPVSSYGLHTTTATGHTGIRHGSKGQFQIAQGEYALVSYWVKIDAVTGVEADPTLKTYLQYTNKGSSGGKTINDVTGNSKVTLKAGTWYKRNQLFLASDSTTGDSATDLTAIRFVVEAERLVDQKIYIGGVKVYKFASGFAYAGLEGANAVGAYLADGDVTGITVDGTAIEGFDASRSEYSVCHGDDAVIKANVDNATADVSTSYADGKTTIKVTTTPYNNCAPVALGDESVKTVTYVINQVPVAENIMNSDYSLDKWQVGGISYIAGGKPELVDDGGEKAMMYDANDSAYAEGATGSFFRAQLTNDYFSGSENWKAGDKIYVSFMARAESRLGKATNASMILDKVLSATGGSKGAMNDSAKFTFTGAWKKYYAILNLKEALPSDCYVRFRLDCGYLGQTTWIKDFNAYFCHGEDSDVINYLQPDGPVYMNKNTAMVISGAGKGDTQLGTLETITEFDEATPVAFDAAYKFTSTEYNNTSNTSNDLGKYKARLNKDSVYSHTANAGDKLLVSYWAKGEYTGSEEGGVAYMRPGVQASVNGSGGKEKGYFDSEGNVTTEHIALSSEWTKYAHILEIPESTGYDMQINWFVGKTNQSVTFADVKLFNLGNVDFATASAYLDDTDAELFYRTKPMAYDEASNTYTAIVPDNAPAVTTADIAAYDTYGLVSYAVTKLPEIGGENGAVTVYAPDGTSKTSALKLVKSFKDAINEADTADKIKTALSFYASEGIADLTNIGTYPADELYALLAAKTDFASNEEIQSFIDEYMQPYMVAELISLDITYTLDNRLYCGYGDITIAEILEAATVSEGASIEAYEYDGITKADTSKLAHEGIKLIVTAANGNSKSAYCLGYAKYVEYSPLAAFGTDDEGNETFTTEFAVKSYVEEAKSYYVVAAEYDEDSLVGFDVVTLTANAADTFTALASFKTTDSASNTFKSMVFEAGSMKPVRKSVVINKSMAGANVLSFGDSITGSYEPGYPTYTANLLGTNSYNGGIGGTTLSYAPSGSAKYISMVKVSDFVSNPEYDFAETDAYVDAEVSGKSNERYHNVLKTVNVADMDYITMLFGTNDYSQNRLLDNPDNKYDISTIKGAARYVFENLYAKNPDVKIVVSAPFYRDRWKHVDVDGVSVEDGLNGDERVNTAGLYLRDYSEAILEVCGEYDIPAYNLYDISDINRFNEEYYLHDGLHPSDAGYKHLAGIFAEILLENK